MGVGVVPKSQTSFAVKDLSNVVNRLGGKAPELVSDRYYVRIVATAIEGTIVAQGIGNLFSVTAASALTDVSTWKTYRNEQYGFEVKYPDDWYAFRPVFQDRVVNVTGNDENVVFGSVNLLENNLVDEATYQGIGIERENGSYYADSKIVDDFWNKLGKYVSGNLVNKFREKKLINGEYFILFDQYNWEMVAQKYNWSPRAVFMHSGNIFLVRPSYNLDPTMFNTFLSTFKFTP